MGWKLSSDIENSIVVIKFSDESGPNAKNVEINGRKLVENLQGKFASVENSAEVAWRPQGGDSFVISGEWYHGYYISNWYAQWDFFYPCGNKCCSGSGDTYDWPIMLNPETGKCQVCHKNQFLNENGVCEHFVCNCPNGVAA